MCSDSLQPLSNSSLTYLPLAKFAEGFGVVDSENTKLKKSFVSTAKLISLIKSNVVWE